MNIGGTQASSWHIQELWMWDYVYTYESNPKTLNKLLLASSRQSEGVKSRKEDVRKLIGSFEFCLSKFDELKLVRYLRQMGKRLTSLEKETDIMKTEISQLEKAREDFNNLGWTALKSLDFQILAQKT